MNSLTRKRYFLERCPPQRKIYNAHIMAEYRISLRLIQTVVVYLNDFICNAAAGFTHASQIKHGGICFPHMRMVALQVGIVYVAFRFNPANKIYRALVACGRALRQEENLLTEVPAEQHLDLSPEIWRNKQPVLYTLSGACKVCNDTC